MIRIKCSIFVTVKKGENPLRKEFSLVYPRYENEMELSFFFNDASNISQYLHNGNPQLQCHLSISADPTKTAKINFSLELKNLSNDMRDLYYSDDIKDLVIEVQNKSFHVNKCILFAIWPRICNYIENFPNILPSEIIYGEVLIGSCLKCNLTQTCSIEDFLEKVKQINFIFTADRMHFILHYVYTGLLRNIQQDGLPNLIPLGQVLGVTHMVEELQESPAFTVAVTKSIQHRHIIEWSNEDILEWEKDGFNPFIMIIQPQYSKIEPLEVTFKIDEHSQEIIAVLHQLDIGHPCHIKCSIRVRKDDIEIHTAIFQDFNDYFAVSTTINKGEIQSMSFTLDMTFHQNFLVKNSIAEFDLGPDECFPNPSLHSEDLLNLFSKGDKYDIALVTKDSKIQIAHSCILCARSLNFLLGVDKVKDESIFHPVADITKDKLLDLGRFILEKN
ncbi:hypothetical protein NPIL_7691 [Nephila pilipes]|uniref:BTB domain-containing protein n=1 Tax=Nephila pilipes TaxID=299642 RepID=A0A8X6NFG2_NEPPI|nr:hypothetical protein NPIL_7691 [Nephila pilipes]